MRLQGQVAIITGAGRNIGEEISKLLASEGAKIAVVDMDKERGEKVAAEIKNAGGDAKGFVANVASEADIEKLVGDVVAQWGRVDILVNNAAISDNKDIFEISKADWDKVIAVTLTGPFLTAKYVAAQIVKQGSAGKIVNVGSTSGFYGRKRAIAYAAAKGGVVALTRAMAVQLAPHNIRVNAAIPNKVGSPVGKDEFDPSRPVVNLRGRPGVAMDMARAVLFLVSDDSDFVVGDMLFVDGGVTSMMVGE
ncbi:MAG TPA: SDR family NAD(P)-dependent oxidoreductase [Herbaspirillum sp.]|jgi:NAD(P)-dependent dehydrogenase (short-subunit alcohol dehydrogenase family)